MRQMILLLTLFCSITGCGENDAAQSDVQFVNFNEEFQIGVGEKAIIAGNASGEITDSLLIEVVNLQDGRCGKGMNCIRGGSADLRVTVSKRKQAEEIATCIGPDCGFTNEEFENPTPTEIDTTNFTLDNNTYTMIFKDAIPFPALNDNNSDKRAVLKVIR